MPTINGQRLYGVLFIIAALLAGPSYGDSLVDLEASYYYVGCYTARTDILKESIYSKTPQTCVEICEHERYRYAILSAERCFCSNDAIETDRQDELLCNTRCLANKSQYCGGVGVHSYYTSSSKLTVRSQPHNLRVSNSSEHSLTVQWDAYEPPKMFIAGAETSGPMTTLAITNFLIKSRILKTYSALPIFQQPEFIVQSSETRFEITDLQPATEYNVSVEAMCDSTLCGSAWVRGETEVGVPGPDPPVPKVLSSTDTTITVEIPPIRNDNGPVTKVFVIVERVDDALSQPFDTDLLGSWQKAQDDGLPYYIAAELLYDSPTENRTRQFVVGDGNRYGPYTNPPLDNKENHFHVSLGLLSTLHGVSKALYTRGSHDQHKNAMDDFSYATFDTGRESVIALTVTCVVFGTCLVLSLVAYFYLRFKTNRARGGRLRNTHEMTMQQPIIDRDNGGYEVEDDDLPNVDNFKQQFDSLLETMPASKRMPRSVLRMNVNDVLAEGRYGEVISGKIVSSSVGDGNTDCQLHVLAVDDLSGKDQAHLLQDFRKLTRLQTHEHILEFYGYSASADWFYLVFEHQTVNLKRRLIEGRRAAHTAPVQRITSLSEELVLQWIYELASAMDYLSGTCKIVHKQLCSHNVYVNAEAKLKLSLFGPMPYVSNQRKIDITRWLAPETLRYQHFSTKSDVWSFACVAWECCSLGGTPYANISNSQLLLEAIKGGSRPAQPAYVFGDLYQLLLNCWQLEPSDRVSFEEIAYTVRQLMTSPRHALSFNRAPDVGDSNVVDVLPFYMPLLEMQQT